MMQNEKLELIVFDMDGVLVDVESSWRLIHESLNVDSSKNIRSYLGGEIDYKEFMSKDIQLWGPIHIGTVKRILDRVPLMHGATEALHVLKARGYRTAILSAGISILAHRVQSELGIDFVLANELLADKNGMLTGEGVEVVNLLDKVSAFNRLMSLAGSSPRRCAVVGDSVFDVPLFERAVLSIAFNAADERVKEAAAVVVDQKDLTKILTHFSAG